MLYHLTLLACSSWFKYRIFLITTVVYGPANTEQGDDNGIIGCH